MVSPKTLASYNFTTIDEYFDMIHESATNGNRKHAVHLFQTLDKKQRVACLKYMVTKVLEDTEEGDGAYDGSTLGLCIDNIYSTQY